MILRVVWRSGFSAGVTWAHSWGCIWLAAELEDPRGPLSASPVPGVGANYWPGHLSFLMQGHLSFNKLNHFSSIVVSGQDFKRV